MPQSFPDFESLKRLAKAVGFRPPFEGETEADYREALALFNDNVLRDRVQAHEVRTGKGWDMFDDEDKSDFVRRLFNK